MADNDIPVANNMNDDAWAGVVSDVTQRGNAALRIQQATRTRRALDANKPAASAPAGRPLSPASIAHLAQYGISGPRTYEDALAHIHTTATTLGLRAGATKKLGDSGVSSEASLVRARIDPGQQRGLNEHEANLLDQVHTLHTGIKLMMTRPTSTGAVPTPNIRAGRDPSTALTEQKILSQGLDVTTEMRAERESPGGAPRDGDTSIGVKTPPGVDFGGSTRLSGGRTAAEKRELINKATESLASRGRPLLNLPPAKNKRELSQRIKMIDAGTPIMKPSRTQHFQDGHKK